MDGLTVTRRSDEWAVTNPPEGEYWVCWQCLDGEPANAFVLHFIGWPAIEGNWYIAGPFVHQDNATNYDFDGANPCADNGFGVGDSTNGGGSNYSDNPDSGGGRFYFITTPTLFGPDSIDSSPVRLNGQPFTDADFRMTFVDLPPGLMG